jgi:hypothetical protein
MRPLLATLMWGSLCACVPSSSDPSCDGDGLVGLSTFASTTIAPGASLEERSFQPVCKGQCPLTRHRWQILPAGGGYGVVRVTYGAHCGPTSGGELSNDQVGSCQLPLRGGVALTDAVLADSHDADCVALWAEINSEDPDDNAPCGKGSSLSFAPFIVFFNDSTAPVTITGPGPASNPTAMCSYAPG